MGRPYAGKPTKYVKWVGQYPYVYERLERPIRRLSPSELASRTLLESLIPKRSPAGVFYYAKKVGPYGYMVEVSDKYVRPATVFESKNPQVLKSLLPAGGAR